MTIASKHNHLVLSTDRWVSETVPALAVKEALLHKG